MPELPPWASAAVPEVTGSCRGSVLAPGQAALPAAQGTDGRDDLEWADTEITAPEQMNTEPSLVLRRQENWHCLAWRTISSASPEASS